MNVKYAVTGMKRFIAPGPIWAYKNESPGYGFIGTRHLSWSPFLRTKQTKNIPCSWSVCNVYIANPVFLLMFIMKCKKNELNKTLCKNLLTVIGGQCTCEKFLANETCLRACTPERKILMWDNTFPPWVFNYF